MPNQAPELHQYILDHCTESECVEYLPIHRTVGVVDTDEAACRILRRFCRVSDGLYWSIQRWRDHLQSWEDEMKKSHHWKVIQH